MAEITPPAWQENASNRARQARLISTALVSGGVWRTNDLVVSAPGGSMQVTVGIGGCYVPASGVFGQGYYACYTDSSVTKTLAAGGAVARIDLIVAKVTDTEFGDASNAWSIAVVDGSSVAPGVPATPARTYVLARVAVAAGAASITGANITDVRDTAAIVRPDGFRTGDLRNASITPDKLALGPQHAVVSTSETTTSTAYTDLTTVGPTVTVTVGANGLLEVHYNARLANSQAATTSAAFCAVQLSGANTYAPTDLDAIEATSAVANHSSTGHVTKLFSGLTAGVTTVRLKYRSSVGTNTATFTRRMLTAVPL